MKNAQANLPSWIFLPAGGRQTTSQRDFERGPLAADEGRLRPSVYKRLLSVRKAHCAEPEILLDFEQFCLSRCSPSAFAVVSLFPSAEHTAGRGADGGGRSRNVASRSDCCPAGERFAECAVGGLEVFRCGRIEPATGRLSTRRPKDALAAGASCEALRPLPRSKRCMHPR